MGMTPPLFEKKLHFLSGKASLIHSGKTSVADAWQPYMAWQGNLIWIAWVNCSSVRFQNWWACPIWLCMNNSKSVHFNRGLEREDRMEGSSGAYWDVKVSKIGNYALSWSGLVCKMLRRKKHGSSIINIHSWGVTTVNSRVDTQPCCGYSFSRKVGNFPEKWAEELL